MMNKEPRHRTEQNAIKCSQARGKTPKDPEQAYETHIRGSPSDTPIDERHSSADGLIETIKERSINI
jgi:hypothetical protein